MTYIVGVKYGPYSAILCDSRVTFENSPRDAENTWLKSGLFFHGCMFAYCGAVYPARKFIIECRTHLSGYGTIESFWENFCRFVESYDFPKGDDSFQLLLSSRANESVQLYILDSEKGHLEKCASNIVTLGSGTAYLDEFVYANFGRIYATGNKEIDAKPESSPWMWCLQLMERVQGLEVARLQELGVGGYFHFSYQTPFEESRQPPAVYVLCDYVAEKQLITSWAYRISFCKAALVVECPINNVRYIILDPAAWPRAEKLSEQELADYEQEINQLTVEQPYYNFCGFGTINPSHRKWNPAVITNEPHYLINRDGTRDPNYAKFAASIFASGAEIEALISNLNHKPAPSI